MKFEMIFGVIEDYGHNNKGITPYEQVAKEVREILEQHFEETGVFIGGSLSELRTLYHQNWGCPESGEATYKFEGSFNPEFAAFKIWEENVLRVAQKIKRHFQQSTMTIEFVESNLIYLDKWKEEVL